MEEAGNAAAPLLPPAGPSAASNGALARHLKMATRLSWAANWLLLVLKIAAFALSMSKAVLASLADSAVDLASQMVLSVAEHSMKRYNPRFPIGRGKLEALAVICCASIMSMASLEVVQFSALDLYNGWAKGERPSLELGPAMFAILLLGSAMKLSLYWYCNWLKGSSDSMGALAEDHINDVASNLGALLAAVVVKAWPEGWWVDGAAAIVIALVIMLRWSMITYSQVLKIVGQAAPEAFTRQVEALAAAHHPALEVDVVRCYHFGPRYNVEMEVVLPGAMTVAESHDIALDLQHKLEALEDVERAFVHVDYEKRSWPEHKVERTLMERQAARRGATSQQAQCAQLKFLAMVALLVALTATSVAAQAASPPPAGNSTVPLYQTNAMVSVLPILLLFFIPISLVFCCTVCMN
ncbi:CDF membrane isoform A [Chlorella sorokiniana]|uniref:CDF membrane isoform A n=1 Tax=Chlorella sorokiniana TaxID=3076 RepID=A0A2P6TU61_CHLSO|nr:CDF membrane isoform A [Chlorella sorokiniana]|eukprot:PRW57612.1 CDF membrane isoform A [Chlorella sorokiniana]